jgi:hypothetical protein
MEPVGSGPASRSATLQNPILNCDQRVQVFSHVVLGLLTEAALLGPSVFAAFAFEYLNRLAGSRVQETGKQTRLFAGLSQWRTKNPAVSRQSLIPGLTQVWAGQRDSQPQLRLQTKVEGNRALTLQPQCIIPRPARRGGVLH